jgi:hypothetical protein
LRFLDQGASIDVPDGFVDRSVYNATDGARRVIVRPCAADCATESACVDAVVARLRQTLGPDLKLLERGELRVGGRLLASADLEASVMGQAQWLRLFSGSNAQGVWFMQLSAPKADATLLQTILQSLRDTAGLEPSAAPAGGATRCWFAGSICCDLPARFTASKSATFESEGGSLNVELGEPGAPPEDVFYSAPPLEELDQLQSKLQTPYGPAWLTERTVKAYTPQGANEMVHLSATLPLPRRPELSCVATGKRTQRQNLDAALRHLLNSVRIAKQHG